MIQSSEDIEKAVLGSILIDGQAGIHHLRSAQALISKPEMFFFTPHRQIWQTMLEVGDGVDVTTLAQRLKEKGELEEVGDWKFLLIELSQSVATAAHIEHYARLVARSYYEREINKAAITMSTSQSQESLELITRLVLAREDLSSPPMFDYTVSLADMLDEITDDKKVEKTYKFNFMSLDRLIHGLKKGEVNTFGAATNQGKSLLLLNLMDFQARAGERCLFVGSEMSARETFSRHLSMTSGVASWKIREGGKVLIPDIDAVHTAISEILSTLPITILDYPSPTLEKIETAIGKSKAGMVFIDYLERMTLPKAENLRLAVKEFMRRLKTLARKTNVVIFLASQLNRNTYSTLADTTPTLGDLSESSAIEKESDRVFLMWKPKSIQVDDDGLNSRIEIIKAKDRHGPNGLKTILRINGKTLRIEENLQ